MTHRTVCTGVLSLTALGSAALLAVPAWPGHDNTPPQTYGAAPKGGTELRKTQVVLAPHATYSAPSPGKSNGESNE